MEKESSIYDKTKGTRIIESPALGIALNVYDAGTFKDPETGELKSYEAGIKLRLAGLKYPVKLNPLQAKFLRIALNNPELIKEIDLRAEELKKGLMNL